MKRRKTKVKKSTLAVIAFSVLIAIVIIILIFSNQKTQTKPPAREYFEIFDITAFAEPQDSENKTIKIWLLDFKIKPIGGDAHDVVIIPPGMVEEEDWPNFEGKVIRQNETVSLSESGMEIMFPYSVSSTRNTNGSYPITLRIACDETGKLPDDKKVTIYIIEWYPL